MDSVGVPLQSIRFQFGSDGPGGADQQHGGAEIVEKGRSGGWLA
jgi:hypothetical protein